MYSIYHKSHVNPRLSTILTLQMDVQSPPAIRQSSIGERATIFLSRVTLGCGGAQVPPVPRFVSAQLAQITWVPVGFMVKVSLYLLGLWVNYGSTMVTMATLLFGLPSLACNYGKHILLALLNVEANF